jgi:hypothetical protein
VQSNSTQIQFTFISKKDAPAYTNLGDFLPQLVDGYPLYYSTVQETNLTFELAFTDPDGSWDNGFNIKVNLLQTMLFANYTVNPLVNPYLYQFNIMPTQQTPPANYTIEVLLTNLTDGTLLRKYNINVQIVFLTLIKTFSNN